MNRVYEFLKTAETYYLATVEGDQPRVRPFGTVHMFEGKLYIQTGKGKNVAKQIAANPKVELCAMKGDEWIRVAGTLVLDDRTEAQESMGSATTRLFAPCTRRGRTAIPPSIISKTPRQPFLLSRTNPLSLNFKNV